MDVHAFQINETFFPPARFQTFGELANPIITILISVSGAISFIFIIIGGFKFVTSSGDQKKIASASSTLTYAIIGLAVSILAFIIVQALQTFLGSSVEIT